ncbi:TPA: hypothetical protein TUU08_000805 [Streptococcus equi subsp. zooepidemicus]|nr:hypothetical protein [Streptococcus equi subsp. zooepidemicus]HEL0196745.1 hypothetical protein [Streptococcus equi subsp. zooepidemicus]HEL0206619.1 hypothetical protein [Streptococcus equi subsp. zooepidemicus]HEL0532231.1 hypothetical protein [Streptococcus equi subsp. zooepidemicus]HEL0567683.1 hypothetical protein [Streptococcus equi subsp. zooepidemicus]
MKKKLVMILALYAVGVSANVKAEDIERGYYGDDDHTLQPKPTGDSKRIGFRNDWDQAREFGVKPIKVEDQKIQIKTYPGAMIRVYKKSNSNIFQELYEIKPTRIFYYNNPTYEIKYILADSSGLAIFDLTNSGIYEKEKLIKQPDKPQQGNSYTVSTSLDGIYLGSAEWTVGESIPKDIEEKDEEEIQKFVEALENKEKEKADREQKYAEALFRNAIATEANKTWYQRLGDNIEDTWANVKGWWRG